MRGGVVAFQRQGLQIALIELNEITNLENFAEKLFTEGQKYNSVNAMHIAKQIVGQETSYNEQNVFFMVNNIPVGFIQFVIDDEKDIEIKYLGCWYTRISREPIYPERSPGQVMMAMFNIYLQKYYARRLIYLQSVTEAIDYYKTCGFKSYGDVQNSYVLTKDGNGGTLDFASPDEVLYSYVSEKYTIEDILRSYRKRNPPVVFKSDDDDSMDER